jgi:hypothetical protein
MCKADTAAEAQPFVVSHVHALLVIQVWSARVVTVFIWTARTTTWAAHLSRRLTLSVSSSQVPFCSAITCTLRHSTALLPFCVHH